MTITLLWWVLPLGLVGAAVLIARRGLNKPRGDWGFIAGLPELAEAACCLAFALGIAIGHFLA